MKEIKTFVEQVFAGVRMDEDLSAHKEELILNMSDRYRELKAMGLEAEVAYAQVIDHFGSVEDFRKDLDLESREKRPEKMKANKALVLLFMGIILALAVITYQYKENRRYLREDLHRIAYELNQISMRADDANRPYDEGHEDIGEIVHGLEDHHQVLLRNLDPIERRAHANSPHDLFLSHHIASMHEKLVLRRTLGYWDDQDQAVYEAYVNLTEALLYKVEKENFRLDGKDLDDEGVKRNPLITLITTRLDIKGITDLYHDLNLLAASYHGYGLLPGELRQLGQEEVVTIIETVFGPEADHDLDMTQYEDTLVRTGEIGRIKVGANDVEQRVRLEAVYGQVTEVHNFYHGREAFWQEPYPINDVEALAGRLFGEDWTYDITQLKESRTFSSRDTYHSYEIVPTYKGYPVYFRHVVPELHFSANNPNAFLFFGEQYMPNIKEVGEHQVAYGQITALEKAFSSHGDYMDWHMRSDVSTSDFTYETTAYVKSQATSKYDLMHIYNYSEDQRQVMVHALTAIPE